MGLSAQSPYRFSWGSESAWVGGSGAGIGVSFALSAGNQPFTPDQIAALSPSRIPKFDRYALRHYSAPARRASDVLAIGAYALPALLLFNGEARPQTAETGLLAFETILLSTALTQLTKELAHRPRPYVYNPNVPLEVKCKRNARKSFFSGHTSTVAALTFVTAKIWSDHHPHSHWQPAMWAGAVALPAATGFFRMQGGKHFLSDVAVGFAAGAATGWLVPTLHKQRG